MKLQKLHFLKAAKRTAYIVRQQGISIFFSVELESRSPNAKVNLPQKRVSSTKVSPNEFIKSYRGLSAIWVGAQAELQLNKLLLR